MNTDTAPSFIKGLQLSQHFYDECVQPLLAKHFPTLRYSAARIGHGSDVLGFDTAQSMDHDWGLKLMLFLEPDALTTQRDEIDHCLRTNLPYSFRGFTTNFGTNDDGTTRWEPIDAGPVNHGITFHSVDGYFEKWLNINPNSDFKPVDWLTTPQQILRSLTAGSVFSDGLQQLEPIRTKLAYYPHDVWLYMMANQWRRIAQEEAFMGRCGQAGDELGSRLVAQRLVMDIMWLCFLLERVYAPYTKWFGSAFAALSCASILTEIFHQILNAQTWPEREVPLTVAYKIMAQMHNDLEVTDPLSTATSLYHKRPFQVIHADRFVDALYAKIEDADVLALPRHLGSVDQFVDSTDVLSYPQQLIPLRSIYKTRTA